MERSFMKWIYRFILPVLLLLSVDAKSQAYTYIHFPEPNLTWYGFQIYHAMGTFWTSGWTTHMYGDIIINNKTYRSIGGSYFREDSLKRVYYIQAQDTSLQEILVYDFSLSVGDTMRTGIRTFSVIRVDTLDYCGTVRRTLRVSHDGVNIIDSWAEGLGSVRWGPRSTFIDCDCGIWCIAQDSVLRYGCGSTSCAAFYTSVEESSFQQLKISPNPVTTSFTLQLPSPPTTQTYFLLYDALGRRVKREEIVLTTTTINRDNLPNGIYFWQLQSDNKIRGRGKMVLE